MAASHNPSTASYAVTFQPWTSGVAQQAGMWFQVELPEPARLTEIVFESVALAEGAGPTVLGAPPRSGGGRGAATGPVEIGAPRAYQVQVSMDGTTWSAPVAQGRGAGAETAITFAPVEARFVRITQTATDAGLPPWSIQRLRLYESAR
jgi:hypothetical protein